MRQTGPTRQNSPQSARLAPNPILTTRKNKQTYSIKSVSSFFPPPSREVCCTRVRMIAYFPQLRCWLTWAGVWLTRRVVLSRKYTECSHLNSIREPLIKVFAPVVMLKRIFHVFRRSLRHSYSCSLNFGECFMSTSVVSTVVESLRTKEKICLFASFVENIHHIGRAEWFKKAASSAPRATSPATPCACTPRTFISVNVWPPPPTRGSDPARPLLANSRATSAMWSNRPRCSWLAAAGWGGDNFLPVR